MRDYRVLLEQKAKMPDVTAIQQDIESTDNWVDAYWIGMFVYEQASGEADKLVMDAYEKAFSLGLNIRTNQNRFLRATQQIARIYFHFRKYDEAINKLMVLDSNVDDLPDWVNLYYASAQIHTETVLYWAEVPELLFKRIDKINESDADSVKRRKYLFLEFLNRISELSKTKDVSQVDKEAILAKAAELGVANSRECITFKVALGIIPALPDIFDDSRLEAQSRSDGKNASVYEQMVTELNKRLAELQAIIDKQALTIAQDKKNAEEQQKRISGLCNEIRDNNINISRQAEELKAAKEREYAALARCNSLESQLSGNEAAKQQLQENAAIIGELRADVEDLKTALTVTKENNGRLKVEIAHNQQTIESLKEELLRNQEETQGLHATIESQKAQIEVAEAAVKSAELAVKAAEERAAKVELAQETGNARERSSGSSAQPTLLDILTVDNYLPRRQKILIIGGSEAKENHLRGKLKNMGFTFSKDQLEFELDYTNVKDYTSRIIPWSSKYAGIIVGPCPHKAKDIDGYSSFIEQIKSEEGYPHVEEARDKSGNLKISNTSIGEAMMRMAVYLQSIA